MRCMAVQIAAAVAVINDDCENRLSIRLSVTQTVYFEFCLYLRAVLKSKHERHQAVNCFLLARIMLVDYFRSLIASYREMVRDLVKEVQQP